MLFPGLDANELWERITHETLEWYKTLQSVASITDSKTSVIFAVTFGSYPMFDFRHFLKDKVWL